MKYDWIDAYLLNKKGVEKDYKKEWGWFRYTVGGKLFCAVCMADEGLPYFITVKLEPARGDALRQIYPDILPGYYMNKAHWNSVKVDGAVPNALLQEMLDESYELVLHGLTKKKQNEIMEDNQ